MVLHLVRILFLLVAMATSITLGFQAAAAGHAFLYVAACIVLPVLAAFLLVMADMLWKGKRLQVLSGLFFGVLAGLVLAYGLSLVVDLSISVFEIDTFMAGSAVAVTKALLSAGAIFLCVSFVLQTKDDFRFIIPYVEFSRQSKGSRPLLLDTSVIVDGRVADVADTGVLESEAIVPRFVLAELHALADSEDKLKRKRGQRGLDVLNRLRSCQRLDVTLLDVNVPAVDKAAGVDEKLMALADHLSGRVVTNDYNLNKVAKVRGVDVININDLANALKPMVIAGELIRVQVLRAGDEAGQGVGYLEDGTMVVVEGGREKIGQAVDITVTSVLQTSAGRMIFGRTEDVKPPPRGRGR
jgi:uncharacterized protein YacL